MEVDRGGVDAFMSEPQRDDRGVDSRFEQSHRGGVAQHVGGDVLGRQRRAFRCRGAVVACESVLDGVAAEVSAGAGREDTKPRARSQWTS